MSAASATTTSAAEPSFDDPSAPPPSAPEDPPELDELPLLLLPPELLLAPELPLPPELLEVLAPIPPPELLAPLLDEVPPLPELLPLPLPEPLLIPPPSLPGSAGVPLEQPGPMRRTHTASADAFVMAIQRESLIASLVVEMRSERTDPIARWMDLWGPQSGGAPAPGFKDRASAGRRGSRYSVEKRWIITCLYVCPGLRMTSFFQAGTLMEFGNFCVSRQKASYCLYVCPLPVIVPSRKIPA